MMRFSVDIIREELFSFSISRTVYNKDGYYNI